MIVGIVIGSTGKGLLVGLLAGWFATRVHSIPAGLTVGLALGALFAFVISGDAAVALLGDHPAGQRAGVDCRVCDAAIRPWLRRDVRRRSGASEWLTTMDTKDIARRFSLVSLVGDLKIAGL